MKFCKKCNKSKSIDCFYRNTRYKDGCMRTCKSCRINYQKNYYSVNSQEINKKTSRTRNSEQLKQYNKTYHKNNLPKFAAKTAKYMISKLKATPKWLTKEHLQQIEKFYIEAYDLTIKTGILYEVDHIIPLQGKNVSGLHVPWNLQILTKTENIKKKNKVTI